MSHHDMRPLPNGNILVLAVEKKTYDEAIAAGFNPAKFQPEILQKGYMLPDYVIEVESDLSGRRSDRLDMARLGSSHSGLSIPRKPTMAT